MENRLKRILDEELKLASNTSTHINSLRHNINYARDLSELVTIITQGIISIESQRQELFDVLVERKRFGL